MNVRPTPTTRRDASQLEDSVDELSRSAISRVSYGMLEGSADDFLSADVVEIDFAIQVDLGRHRLRFDWAIDGWREGLAVQIGEPLPTAWRIDDVTESPGWRRLRGARLLRLDLSWQRTEDDIETVAAVKLSTDQGDVVISLGELKDGCPSYAATSLLCFFDELAADAFVSSIGDSWEPATNTHLL